MPRHRERALSADSHSGHANGGRMLDALLLLAAAGATSALLVGGGSRRRRRVRIGAGHPAETATSTSTEFLSTSLAHELRTPLNSIIGFSDLLLAGVTGELNAEQRRQLEMIRRSGAQLLEVIARSSLTTPTEPDDQSSADTNEESSRSRAGRQRIPG